MPGGQVARRPFTYRHGLQMAAVKAGELAYKHKDKIIATAKRGYKAVKSYTDKKSKKPDKKKRKKQIIYEPAQGESRSYCLKKKKPSKFHQQAKALTNVCTIEWTDDNTHNSGNLGLQGVNNLNGINANAGVYGNEQGAGALVTGGSNGDVYNLMERTFQFYNTTVPAQVRDTPFQTNYKSTKFLLESATMETDFVNAGSDEFQMIIYDCIAKHTQSTLRNPITDWTSGITDQQGSDTASLTAGTSKNSPNSKPTLSKIFNMEWKVIKVTEVSVSPGRTHKHLFHEKIRRIIDWEYFNTNEQIGGMTYAPIVTIQGRPVGTADAANPVTLSYCKMNYVTTTRLRGRALSAFPRQTWQKNTIKTSAAGLTATLMNDDTSVPLTYVSAGTLTGFAS